MRERVPSASRRVVSWLNKGPANTSNRRSGESFRPAVAAPREGFGDNGGEGRAEGEAIGGETTRPSLRDVDSGNELAAARSLSLWTNAHALSTEARAAASYAEHEIADSFPETGEEGALGSGSRLDSLSSDYGMYISPGMSPESDDSTPFGSTAATDAGENAGTFVLPSSPTSRAGNSRRGTLEGGKPTGAGGDSAVRTAVPLIDRIQEAIEQRLALDGTGGGALSLTKRRPRWFPPARRGAAATPDHQFQPQEPVSRTRDGCSPAEKGGAVTDKAPRLRGEPAWGQRSKSELDPLLPPPASTLPPLCSHDSEAVRGGATQGRRVEAPTRGGGGDGGAGSEQRDGRNRNFGKGGSSLMGATEGGGATDDKGDELADVDAALEWPSLLGAIGSKAPLAASPPPSPSVWDLPPSRAASASSIVVNGGGDGNDGTPRVGGETAAAAALVAEATVATKAEDMAWVPSSPHSPLVRPLPSATSSPARLPPPPRSPAKRSSSPPPLPSTCRGVGVEVADRLRERAWFRGTRVWGEPKKSAGRQLGRGLEEGFDRDAVGSLFPLDMILQVGAGVLSVRCLLARFCVRLREYSFSTFLFCFCFVLFATRSTIQLWPRRANGNLRASSQTHSSPTTVGSAIPNTVSQAFTAAFFL